ncbi:hypothetical protein Elgi_51010 [Paenibacillus elgii]|nr:hypothetical protein Elgi_51010 [Paenibacillus elgii]
MRPNNISTDQGQTVGALFVFAPMRGLLGKDLLFIFFYGLTKGTIVTTMVTGSEVNGEERI